MADVRIEAVARFSILSCDVVSYKVCRDVEESRRGDTEILPAVLDESFFPANIPSSEVATITCSLVVKSQFS